MFLCSVIQHGLSWMLYFNQILTKSSFVLHLSWKMKDYSKLTNKTFAFALVWILITPLWLLLYVSDMYRIGNSLIYNYWESPIVKAWIVEIQYIPFFLLEKFVTSAYFLNYNVRFLWVKCAISFVNHIKFCGPWITGIVV